LLSLAIRGNLNEQVSGLLIELSIFFRQLCSKVLRVNQLEKMEKDIALTLCKLEMIFPPSFFDVMMHLPVHLATEAKLGGPVQYRWMYPIERYNVLFISITSFGLIYALMIDLIKLGI
jgi:hypothetical protein